MKLIIDGKAYEVDGDFLVKSWYLQSEPYVNPDKPEGKKYADLRLAAKAALRLRLPTILKSFAKIFQIDDWRELQPKRGEDMLVKLHQYMTGLLRAEANTLVVEFQSELGDGDSHDSQGSMVSDAGTRLALTRAGFAGQQKPLYERPGAGRAITDTPGQHPALSAVTSSGRLVGDADAPEI